MLVNNKDHRSSDYDTVKNTYRPSHADFTTEAKYGIRDYRGGGRSSARETIARVASGAIAKQLLATENISIQAYVSQVGDVKCTTPYALLNLEVAEKNIVRCPDEATAAKMIALIEEVRQDGDSIGGVITCVIKNCPAGLGEPVFDKLHADMAKAMMSINATRAFEIGDGFDAVPMRGSAHNDAFTAQDGKVMTTTNHSAGIQGGISNGMDIYFRVAFKPVATISKQQQTVTIEKEATTLEVIGRHDPCVVPRAVPIVEAMAALVLADHWLRQRCAKL
jgi:chorismate synthase